MKPVIQRESWLLQFADELRKRRPSMSLKFAYVIASNEWPRKQAVDPEEAARLWVEETDKSG